MTGDERDEEQETIAARRMVDGNAVIRSLGRFHTSLPSFRAAQRRGDLEAAVGLALVMAIQTAMRYPEWAAGVVRMTTLHGLSQEAQDAGYQELMQAVPVSARDARGGDVRDG